MREDMKKHRRHGRWPLATNSGHVPHELQEEPVRAMRWARHAALIWSYRRLLEGSR